MDAEQALHPELTPLNSSSATAIWRLWRYITAQVIILFEELMDLFKIDIQNIIDNSQYGTDPWWYKTVLAFQFGDTLQLLNNIYQYATIDATKQVVKFCSISSSNGKVLVKAAGADGSGQPIVLTDDQLSGLVSYCQQKRPAGIRFTVQSLAADLLKVIGNIYYDAAADPAVIKPAVKAAVTAFLQSMNSLNATGTANFDGTLYVNKLIDAIQAVPGLKGNQFDLLQIAAKNGADDYTVFTSSYQPKSGYFMIDPAFDLDTTLTYISA